MVFVAYQIPSNTLGYPTARKGISLLTEHRSGNQLSTGAGKKASLGLAVAGLVATFTPAAPIAPYWYL